MKSDFDLFIEKIKTTEDDFCNMRSNYHLNNGKDSEVSFKKHQITSVVMKHTTHHNLMEHLIKWNPQIKIIGLIRDPSKTIESQMKAKHEKLVDWLNGEDKNMGIRENYFGFNKWRETHDEFVRLKEQYKDNVYLVRYEDLVKDPLEEIRKLFLFCNLVLTQETKNFIYLSTSTTNDYDYSVFKNKEQMSITTTNLSAEITQHINNKYPKIAIIIAINDLLSVNGTTQNGIKGELGYVEQFLMLYYSINDNWFFNYKIYIAHSRDFSGRTLTRLSALNVSFIKIDTPNLLVRPESYLVNIDCDYRLVLDADMIALSNPSFNFNYDAQGMYGDFDYETLPSKLFSVLKITKPNANNYQKYATIKTMPYLWSIKHTNLVRDFYKTEFSYTKKYLPDF